MELLYGSLHDDTAAQLFHFVSCDLPELSGAKLRVLELLDKRGVHLAVLDPEHLAEEVLDYADYREPLCTLSSP